MNYLRTVLALLSVMVFGTAQAQTARFLENVLVRKTDGVTTVQLRPNCRMRYIDHQPAGTGSELRLQVSTTSACSGGGNAAVNETFIQDGLRLANVTAIDIQSWRTGELYITLRFSEPSSFVVRQRAVGWIEIDVDTRVDPSTLAATRPPPLDTVDPAEPESNEASRLATLRARQQRLEDLRRTLVETSDEGNFVVQLGVFSDPGPVLSRLLSLKVADSAFSREIRINDDLWHGLHLGFFATETTAQNALMQLSGDFPDAFIRRIRSGDTEAAQSAALIAADTDLPVAVVASREAVTDADLLASLYENGRQAVLNRQHALAIAPLTELLEYPDHAWRADGRELLAVAFERNGQTDRAMAEYNALLLEVTDPIAMARIRARLDGLEARTLSETTERVSTRSVGLDAWTFDGGVSHYYWRNQEQLVEDGNYLVSSSGVVGLLNASARRNGERWSLLMRVNGSYQNNLVEFDERGDVGWVSAAFVEASDNVLGLRARLGRQNNRGFGVLDRFDGATVDWKFLPGFSAGLSLGLPVDSPRFIGDSSRQFIAARVAAEELLDSTTSVSLFAHQQTANGLLDRQAIGGEVLYRDGDYSVFGLLDYDASYAVLNTALVNLNWRFRNGWTLTSRLQAGARPYLTTRNALAGQAAVSLEQLGDSYTEGQIRRLARDRTAENRSFAMGLSIPLGDRMDLSADITINNTDATVASGGVAQIPATGTELFAIASLVTTNVLGAIDLFRVSTQYQQSDWRTSTHMILDGRFAIGRRLRLTTGLRVESHERTVSGEEQRVLAPSIRLQYRVSRTLFDLEIGGRWSDRDLPPFELNPFVDDGSELTYGGYINAGYRLEF
ncbi:MAG: SPOR domain-containing protein [Pseudomonadota bacterium]